MDSQKFARLIVFLKKWIMPVCAGSIFVGIFIESYVTLPQYVIWVLLGMGLLASIVFMYSQKRYWILAVLMCLFLSFGIFRFHQEKEFRKNTINILGQSESFEQEVQIVSPPDYREKSTKIVGRYGDAKILITFPVTDQFHYGDIVKIKGQLLKPEPFETNAGRIFDYSGYLAKDRIFYEIRYPASYEVVGTWDTPYVFDKLFTLKEYLRRNISESHKSDERGLLLGILLGERGGITQENQDAFVATGTIHIVALSGYNVTIISEAIAYMLIPLLGVTFGIIGGAIGVVLFAIMTGLGATIVRATIMGLLAYLSRMLGKEIDIGRALFFAGACMVIQNPWILVYDVSFQLSFLATIGLVYVTPRVSVWFKWITHKGVNEVVSATVATNLTVLPFVAYTMGIVSIVSIPANILIAPLVPLAMLFGSLSVGLYMVFPILALPFISVSQYILSLILSIAKKGSVAPLSHMIVPSFSIGLMLVCYVVLIGGVYYLTKNHNS